MNSRSREYVVLPQHCVLVCHHLENASKNIILNQILIIFFKFIGSWFCMALSSEFDTFRSLVNCASLCLRSRYVSIS